MQPKGVLLFTLLPLLPLIACIPLLILRTPLGSRIGWFALPVPMIAFIAYLQYIPDTMSGTVLVQRVSWVPLLGLDLAFRIDGLSLLFALLISFVGIVVVFYSIFYLSKKERLTNFYVFLMIFMGAMLGVTTSDNLILLYLFWELTSVSSFLLIGFWYEKERSRYGAQKALLITVMGGFCMLVAFVLIGAQTGTFSISALLEDPSQLQASSLYAVIVILLLLGAFTKSAQVPFHIWLPSAMEAPTPISCYLHSATMVKAGIFLIARLTPILGGSQLWCGTVTLVGLVSLCFGSFMALRQKDMKALLAYSTISQLGLIICLFGFGTEAAVIGGLFHLLNHSVFKGSLFLMTGIVDHQTGTRDMTLLRGLAKIMPWTGAVALIGAFSMAGLPPFSGFLSKELFFEAALESPFAKLSFLGDAAWLISAAAVLASLLTFVYSLSIFCGVFLGNPPTEDTPKTPREASVGMLAPALALVSFNLIIAAAPNLFAAALIAPAAQSVGQTAELPSIHLAFWHGITVPLLMTIFVVAAGLILFRYRKSFQLLISRLKSPIGAGKAYDAGVPALLSGSKRLTDFYMTGSLTSYLILIMLATLGLISIPVFRYGLWNDLSTDVLARVELLEIIMVMVTSGAAVMAAYFRRRLYAILAMSVAGYMVSLFFVVFSAPDLALTQLLVESVTLILFLLVLRRFPKGMKAETPTYPGKKFMRIIMSVSVGFTAAFLSFLGVSNQQYQPISWYYTQHSKSAGGGNNVVNVILVDFRGLDTLGEISVLCMAAIGISVLIHLVTNREGHTVSLNNPFVYFSHIERDLRGVFTWTNQARNSNNIILITLAKPLCFMILILAIYLFYAGHNLPGGGFIAGLTVACALVLMYITLGKGFIKGLNLELRYILALGLACSVGCGLGGMFFGKPFLTHTFGQVSIPLVGELELATAMIFDFGVFLVVTATVMPIILTIGNSQRS